MNQAELEARLAAIAPNGDVNRLEFTESTIQRKVTKPNPIDPRLPSTEETVSVPVRVWIDRGTGQTLRVVVNTDGTYEKDYDGIDPKNKGEPATKPEDEKPPTKPQDEVNPSDPTRMRRWNPKANNGQGAFEDAGPNQVEIDRRQKEKDAQAEKDKPKPVQGSNGQWGYWDTKPGQEPKWVQITGGPGEAMKPVEVNGVWGTWKPSTTGGAPTFEPIAGVPQAGTGLKNVDPFVPDYGQGDLGLSAWAQKQAQKIGKPADQGGLTQKEYDSAIKAAHDRATVEVSNVSAMTAAQRQRYIDEQTQQNAARGYAEDDLTREKSVFDSIWKYTTPGSDAIMAWAPDPRRAQALRESYASQVAPPPPLHPMFQGVAERAGVTMTPGTPPAAPTALGAPGGMPAPLLGPPPAVTGSMTPTGPSPQAVQAAQAGVQATGAAIANPSGPNIQAATDASMNGFNQAIAPLLPAAPVVPNADAAAAEAAAQQQAAAAPISMAPPAGPISTWARSAMGQPAPAPQMPVNEGPAAPINPALQAVAAPRFDPGPVAGRLMAMGVPAEAVQAALQEMGLG